MASLPGPLSLLILLNACASEAPPEDCADEDGDGYFAGSDCTESLTDCQDDDASIRPGVVEICDGQDNDCDGEADESDAIGVSPWYADADGDGFGVQEELLRACEQPSGYAATAGDCDEGDPAISPGADELCNGADDDCDGQTDEDALDGETWYPDIDGDGYGDDTGAVTACDQPSGHVALGGDCDDGDPQVHPGAYEFVNERDDDCDGDVDFSSLAGAAGSWLGEAAGDRAGAALAGPGDVDGDGLPDLLIGAPGRAGAYLLSGAEQALDDSALDLTEAWLFLGGESEGDEAGSAVAGAGDVNGDGRPDLLVGAPQHGDAAGAAYLVLGAARGENETRSLADAQALLYGEQAGDLAGCAVAGAGDADDDGFADLLVGAWQAETDGLISGAAYLLAGPVSGTLSLGDADMRLYGQEQDEQAGYALAQAGDIDGDGLKDALVGAPGADDGEDDDDGAAYLVSDPFAGSLALADAQAKFTGRYGYEYLGSAVCGAGDVNGDGYRDMLLGAPGYSDGDEQGRAYLMIGPQSGEVCVCGGAHAKWTGLAEGDRAGAYVSGIGDWNGDGFDDALVGAPGEDSAGDDAGEVYLLLGPFDGSHDMSDAAVRFRGEAAGDGVGPVAGLGDLDGDALPELAVGAPGSAEEAGAVYLLPLLGDEGVASLH